MTPQDSVRGKTALYRCPGSCGRVMRGEDRGPGHAYGCLCDALPNGPDPSLDHIGCATGVEPDPAGHPYFQDREHRFIRFEDDGREVVHDFREGVWLA